MDVAVKAENRARFVQYVEIEHAVVAVTNRASALYSNQLVSHGDLMLEPLNPTDMAKDDFWKNFELRGGNPQDKI